MKILFTFAAVTLAMCSSIQAQVKSPLTPAEWSNQWHELGQEDDTRAMAVVLQWTKSPKEVLGYLKKELKAVKVDAAAVKNWFKDLDSDNFRARKAALLELEYFGKYAKNDFENALKTNLGPEAKQSVEKLLQQIAKREEQAKGPMAPVFKNGGGGVSVSSSNGKIRIVIDGQEVDLTPKVFIPEGPPRSWVRVSRAIGFLEFSRTPEAIELLEKLAGGEPEALPTIKAKEALARVKLAP